MPRLRITIDVDIPDMNGDKKVDLHDMTKMIGLAMQAKKSMTFKIIQDGEEEN